LLCVPEQDHNHNLDSVALNYSYPVSQLRVVSHNRTRCRESGTHEQNYFVYDTHAGLQHVFWTLDGDRTPIGVWGTAVDVF
jgi:hypothetical protein